MSTQINGIDMTPEQEKLYFSLGSDSPEKARAYLDWLNTESDINTMKAQLEAKLKLADHLKGIWS